MRMTFLPALQCEYRSEPDILDDPPDIDLHGRSAPQSHLNKRSLQPNVNQITLRHVFFSSAPPTRLRRPLAATAEIVANIDLTPVPARRGEPHAHCGVLPLRGTTGA
jgi:hypothetical protein